MKIDEEQGDKEFIGEGVHIYHPTSYYPAS